jgi:hypothetical protein
VGRREDEDEAGGLHRGVARWSTKSLDWEHGVAAYWALGEAISNFHLPHTSGLSTNFLQLLSVTFVTGQANLQTL